jgi:hypothetical protein
MKTRVNRRVASGKKTLKSGGGITTPFKIWLKGLAETWNFPIGGYIMKPMFIFTFMIYYLIRLNSVSNSISDFTENVKQRINFIEDITIEDIEYIFKNLESNIYYLDKLINDYIAFTSRMVQFFGDKTSAIYSNTAFREYSYIFTETEELRALLAKTLKKLDRVKEGIDNQSFKTKITNMLTKINKASNLLTSKTQDSIEMTNKLANKN